MSRSSALAVFAAALLASISPAPAVAQNAQSAPATAPASQSPPAVSASAEELLSTAQAVYGPKVPPKTCLETPAGREIVVCAAKPDDAEFRVKSTRELDPDSHKATYDGLPRAPNVHGIPTCKETGNPCISIGKVPSPIYYIDLTKIPEAPPGSDADKIAKGEQRQP